MEEINAQKGTESPPQASPFSPLLQNPAAMAQIMSLLGTLQNQPTPQATEAPKESAAVQTPSAPPIDGLAKILSDPAMMEKLPQIIALLKPMLATMGEGAKEEPAIEASVSVRSPVAARDQLLTSLKPFLSSGRRDAVDQILRLEKLGEFLKQMK